MPPQPPPPGGWSLPPVSPPPPLSPAAELRHARVVHRLRHAAPALLTIGSAAGIALQTSRWLHKRRESLAVLAAARLEESGQRCGATVVLDWLVHGGSGAHNHRRDSIRRATQNQRPDASHYHQPPLRTTKTKRERQREARAAEEPPAAVPPAPPAAAAPRLSETAVDLLCGAAAEAAQLAALYPLDTIKVRCQLSRRHPVGEMKALLAAGGPRALLRALYAGCAPAALGATLFGGLYMLSYKAIYRRNLRLLGAEGDTSMEDGSAGPSLVALSGVAAVSAMLANCATAVVEVPLDSARQRLQAGVAQGSMASLMRASAAAGPRVLYAGFAPFLLRTIPMDALQFCVYEALQSIRERHLAADASASSDEPLTEALADMMLGGIAGGVSAFLTMPLDCVKTHINCGPRGASVVGVAKQIWAVSGPRGFFAGTSSRCGACPCRCGAVLTVSLLRLLERVPSCAVYWLAAEATRRLLTPAELEQKSAEA